MIETPPKHQYVNGREFLGMLKEYHASYLESVRLEQEKPQVSNEIAGAIIQIATRLSNSYNFIGYSYKDEMIADGIYKCLDKVHRFDPNISENPFGFFSQLCWNSFLNRIKIEQKQASIRARLINDKVTSEFVEQSLENDVDATNAFVGFLKDNNIFVDYYEERKTADQTGTIHPSLKHRNLTPYVKKEKEIKVKPNPETNLYDLMGAE